MQLITFPKSEHESVNKRFKEGKTVYTIRVCNECGKYSPGQTLKTEFGFSVRIVKIEKVCGGIDELKKYINISLNYQKK